MTERVPQLWRRREDSYALKANQCPVCGKFCVRDRVFCLHCGTDFHANNLLINSGIVVEFFASTELLKKEEKVEVE